MSIVANYRTAKIGVLLAIVVVAAAAAAAAAISPAFINVAKAFVVPRSAECISPYCNRPILSEAYLI